MKRVVLILMGLSSLTWSEFTAKGGVIKDSNTQLEWQNRDIRILDWESANRYCRNLNLNGTNWRLPTKDELISLVNRYERMDVTKMEEKEPAIDRIFNNGRLNSLFAYWTSSETEHNPHLKWIVDFKKGWAGGHSKNFFYKVRCVRGNLVDNVPMAKLSGKVEESSKSFSDETEGNLVILGDPTPILVKSSSK